MSSKTVKPVSMWAPVVDGARSSWIYHSAIRGTRRQAKETYLEGYEPSAHKKMLQGVRFVRVLVTVEES